MSAAPARVRVDSGARARADALLRDTDFAPSRRKGYRQGVTDVRNPADTLPGADLVEKGLADLAAGAESAEALLVSAGAPRLRALGLPIASPLEDAEHRLYELLARDDPDAAHSRYNALIRRLVSYERAAECAA